MIAEILIFLILLAAVIIGLVYAAPIVGCWASGGYIIGWLPWPECRGVGLS